MNIVIAVTGASGTVLPLRLIKQLDGHDVSLILSDAAWKVASHEGFDLNSIEGASKIYSEDDLMSPLASSSNKVDTMIILPCSMKTLSAIANGYAENLIIRCAENMLKMGGQLIVCPRETPLSLSAIENMRKLKLAGAIILPTNIAYYHNPKSVKDMTDFIIGKILDAAGLENNLYQRWAQPPN
jgi:flavin prenyltransferase